MTTKGPTHSAAAALMQDLLKKRKDIDDALAALHKFVGDDAPTIFVEPEVPLAGVKPSRRPTTIRDEIRGALKAAPEPHRVAEITEILAERRGITVNDTLAWRSLYNNVYSALRRNAKTDFAKHGDRWGLRR